MRIVLQVFTSVALTDRKVQQVSEFCSDASRLPFEPASLETPQLTARVNSSLKNILMYLLTELCPSRGAINWAATQELPKHFMEAEGSILYTQQPSIGP
jgi:hypothetical protein